MPVPALKAIGERYGVPLKRMEKMWAQARAEYGNNYAAVMGTVKKMAANYARGRAQRGRGRAGR